RILPGRVWPRPRASLLGPAPARAPHRSLRWRASAAFPAVGCPGLSTSLPDFVGLPVDRQWRPGAPPPPKARAPGARPATGRWQSWLSWKTWFWLLPERERPPEPKPRRRRCPLLPPFSRRTAGLHRPAPRKPCPRPIGARERWRRGSPEDRGRVAATAPATA